MSIGRPKGARNKKPIQREIVLDMLLSGNALRDGVAPSAIDERLNRKKIAGHIIAQLRGQGFVIDSVRDNTTSVVAYRYVGQGTASNEVILAAAQKFVPAEELEETN